MFSSLPVSVLAILFGVLETVSMNCGSLHHGTFVFGSVNKRKRRNTQYYHHQRDSPHYNEVKYSCRYTIFGRWFLSLYLPSHKTYIHFCHREIGTGLSHTNRLHYPHFQCLL